MLATPIVRPVHLRPYKFVPRQPYVTSLCYREEFKELKIAAMSSRMLERTFQLPRSLLNNITSVSKAMLFL